MSFVWHFIKRNLHCRRIFLCLMLIISVFSVSACMKDDSAVLSFLSSETVETAFPNVKTEQNENGSEFSLDYRKTEKRQMSDLSVSINGHTIPVVWENNESVDALRKLASEVPVTVKMSMYGGFEQVGSLGKSLPRSDVQTTAQPGDIVLYSGSQIVIFYGSNSWAYTRLGRADGLSPAELRNLLGNGNVTMTISVAVEKN